MSTPLEGLRAVELAGAVQGPGVGLYFANMGADVIKVEPPMGDGSRYARGDGNKLPPQAYGPQFVAMNKGKRSIDLDVHTELGAAVMDRLLAEADLFFTNYRASALTRMGLDLEELTRKYPRLVVGHVNGFGPKGPDADKAMLDGAAQARGGLVSLTGEPGKTPTLPGAIIADHAGAMHLALACSTALLTRERTGRGQLVQTSSLGAQLWLQQWELQHYFMTDHMLSRDGPHHPNLRSPYGVYSTSDGQPLLFVFAMDEQSWSDFWIFVERPEVVLLKQWDSPAKRVGAIGGSPDDVAEIRRLMRDAIASKSMDEWVAFFSTQPEIIWERVLSHAQVKADPQNIANDYIVDLDLPVSGPTSTVGALAAFSDTPAPAASNPPALGEHTAEIMTRLGFSSSEIESVQAHSEVHRAKMYEAFFGDSN